jgi:3-methyladenine DNA glycosylase AlkD
MKQEQSTALVNHVLREIAKHDHPENRINYQQFFKEKLAEPEGLKTPILRKISNNAFREIKSDPKSDIFAYCEAFLQSGLGYGRFFAFDWALKIKKQYVKSDFPRFERWLRNHVDNWGACDHLCCGAIGHLVRAFPELSTKTRRWTRSKSRWLRRAAAVSLIVPVKNRLLLDQVFEVADILLLDEDDMVQKGYGWMLKEASNVYPNEVFTYVMKHKDVMPRTALRYAIEKLLPTSRKQAMKRD